MHGAVDLQVANIKQVRIQECPKYPFKEHETEMIKWCIPVANALV